MTDRFQGEQAIKRWQRGEVDEIDRRAREPIDQLRQEREEERDQEQRDRDDLKAKHQQLRDEARREMGIPEPKVREPEQPTVDKPQQQPTHPDMDVRSYVDDYVAGRGRDSREHEQFAANFGREIEEEFQRQAAEVRQTEPEIEADRYGNEIIDMSGPIEPEAAHEEAPPLEPDSYVPDDRTPPAPEHDMDFEMGD